MAVDVAVKEHASAAEQRMDAIAAAQRQFAMTDDAREQAEAFRATSDALQIRVDGLEKLIDGRDEWQTRLREEMKIGMAPYLKRLDGAETQMSLAQTVVDRVADDVVALTARVAEVHDAGVAVSSRLASLRTEMDEQRNADRHAMHDAVSAGSRRAEAAASAACRDDAAAARAELEKRLRAAIHDAGEACESACAKRTAELAEHVRASERDAAETQRGRIDAVESQTAQLRKTLDERVAEVQRASGAAVEDAMRACARERDALEARSAEMAKAAGARHAAALETADDSLRALVGEVRDTLTKHVAQQLDAAAHDGKRRDAAVEQALDDIRMQARDGFASAGSEIAATAAACEREALARERAVTEVEQAVHAMSRAIADLDGVRLGARTDTLESAVAAVERSLETAEAGFAQRLQAIRVQVDESGEVLTARFRQELDECRAQAATSIAKVDTHVERVESELVAERARVTAGEERQRQLEQAIGAANGAWREADGKHAAELRAACDRSAAELREATTAAVRRVEDDVEGRTATLAKTLRSAMDELREHVGKRVSASESDMDQRIVAVGARVDEMRTEAQRANETSAEAAVADVNREWKAATTFLSDRVSAVEARADKMDVRVDENEADFEALRASAKKQFSDAEEARDAIATKLAEKVKVAAEAAAEAHRASSAKLEAVDSQLSSKIDALALASQDLKTGVDERLTFVEAGTEKRLAPVVARVTHIETQLAERTSSDAERFDGFAKQLASVSADLARKLDSRADDVGARFAKVEERVSDEIAARLATSEDKIGILATDLDAHKESTRAGLDAAAKARDEMDVRVAAAIASGDADLRHDMAYSMTTAVEPALVRITALEADLGQQQQALVAARVEIAGELDAAREAIAGECRAAREAMADELDAAHGALTGKFDAVREAVAGDVDAALAGIPV